MGTPTHLGPQESATAAGARQVFIWPPRPAPLEPQEPAPPPPRPAPKAPMPRRRREVLRTIEEAWLGVSARAWGSRGGAESGAADQYCPRCGTTTGPFEADAAGCPACRDKRLVWSRCIRLGSYEGPLREAILAGKYTAWRRTCQDLGAELGLAVAEALREAGVPAERVAVCPVTTSTRRRLARGVDHTAILAREVARATGGRLVRGLRRRHRPPQQGLSADARRRNVAGSFRARERACRGLGGRVVVLVDDVRTTGATLSAAGRALREGIRSGGGREGTIWAAVVAVASRG